MKKQQLTARRALNGLETPDEPILKQYAGLSGPERPYQTPVYDATGIMSNVMGVHPRREAQNARCWEVQSRGKTVISSCVLSVRLADGAKLWQFCAVTEGPVSTDRHAEQMRVL